MTGSGSGDHETSRPWVITGGVEALGPDGYVVWKTGLALAPVRMAIGSYTVVELDDAGDVAATLAVVDEVAVCDGILLFASSRCWSRLESALSRPSAAEVVVLTPELADPAETRDTGVWPAKLDNMAAMFPMGNEPDPGPESGAGAAGASGRPWGPSIVVCDDEDEFRMAAILSEISFPGAGVGAAMEGLRAAVRA